MRDAINATSIGFGKMIGGLKNVEGQMMRRKKEKRDKFPGYEELGRDSVYEGCQLGIPVGATDIAFEIDYSDCYYECDRPSYDIYFLKKR